MASKNKLNQWEGKLRKTKHLIVFLVTAILISNNYAQKLMETVVNEITTTNSTDEDQITIQGDNTIAVAFKRGSGSTQADNEVWVSVSGDGGETFEEQEISFPGYIEQRDVRIISIDTCILVFYEMKDDSGDWWDITARSFNRGDSFQLDSTSKHKNYLLTDGKEKIYSHYDDDLFVSDDLCQSWDTVEAFPPVSASSYEVKVTEDYILVGSYSTSRDSLYLYFSDDDGQTFKELDAFYVDMPYSYAYAVAIDGSEFTLTYVHEEVGLYTLKYKNYNTAGITGEGVVISKTSSMGNAKMAVHKNGDMIATSEDSYWDELYLSNNDGTNWKGLLEIGGSEYIFKDGIFYVLNTETKTGSIKNIVLEKWMLSDIPYISSPSNDSIITPYYSHYFSFTIEAENMWIEDSMTYQFQLASDENFNNILIDSTEYDSYGGSGGESQNINTYYGEDLDGNGNVYYIRVRQYKASDTTNWSESIRIQLGMTSITTVAQLKKSGITFNKNGSNINLIITNDKLLGSGIIDVYNIAGKKVYSEKLNDKTAGLGRHIAIKHLSSGSYFLSVKDLASKKRLMYKFNVMK